MCVLLYIDVMPLCRVIAAVAAAAAIIIMISCGGVVAATCARVYCSSRQYELNIHRLVGEQLIQLLLSIGWHQ